MRKKNDGALLMDFEISPEDRIGGTSKRTSSRAKPVAKTKAKKPARGQRVEPGFAAYDDYQDEPASRSRASKGRAPKARKPARGKRERKPYSIWGLFGRLIYWGATLAVVGVLALA